jgi:DNA-directed RNA polymerase specialized sigma24 family protein
LTSAAFHGLLARLDPDPQRAGEKYEALRRRLTAFFAWRGAPWPEEHADETINRVAKRAAEDDTVLQIEAYAVGVARMVLLEALREKAKERVRFSWQASRGSDDADADVNDRWTCLDRCLSMLSVPEREFILEYYTVRGQHAGGHLEARRAMATKLRIPLHMLRARAFRLRDRLEDCARRCLESAGPGESPSAAERGR